MTHAAHDTSATPNTPHTASPTTPSSDDAGELRYCGRRLTLRGRVLRLILWLAARQRNINEIAPDAGQMWITGKGNGLHSMNGDIKTRLPPSP